MGTSRRGFLQSIAAGSAMAVVHAPAASAEEKTRFDFSTDVVVVGLGAAGAATAITAADKGAQVLVIERLNQSAAPEAMRICSLTMSMPEIASVIGCSTCNRVFISKK